MKHWITKTLLTAIAVYFVAWVLPGVSLETGFLYAIIVAMVLNILNTVVKPVMVVLTLPATILTLGLFIWVINAVVILLAGYFLDDFVVNGFWSALIFSALLSMITSLLHKTFLPVDNGANKSFTFNRRTSINSDNVHTTVTGNKITSEEGKKTIIIEKK